MLNELKDMMNLTKTENGATTYRSTLSANLDLFAVAGTLRQKTESEIIRLFRRAYTEDRDIAMKTLFFSRDIRGGLGERRVFRTVLNWLARESRDSVKKNIRYIPEFGRYDDLLCLIGTLCQKSAVNEIKRQLELDKESLEAGDNVSLLGKWLPSVNATNKETIRLAKILVRELGMKEKDYRKLLSALREKIGIIENNLREKDYSFDYSVQPSKAMHKYMKAFIRNDNERYQEYLKDVEDGMKKMNTRTLYPYEIVEPILNRNISDDGLKALNIMWNNLPNYAFGHNAIAVVDGSGSMYWGSRPVPAAVALSLGIYYAERNTGMFRDHFITFSREPQLVEIKGKTIYDKVKYCESFNEVANTDLEKVFKIILETAVRNKMTQEDLPETIYIISDMEFDACIENSGRTNIENAKLMFEEKGYVLPQIVFWRVSSRSTQYPVKYNEAGVAIVSGNDPKLFSMVMENELDPERFDPYNVMMSILGSERYACITA